MERGSVPRAGITSFDSPTPHFLFRLRLSSKQVPHEKKKQKQKTKKHNYIRKQTHTHTHTGAPEQNKKKEKKKNRTPFESSQNHNLHQEEKKKKQSIFLFVVCSGREGSKKNTKKTQKQTIWTAVIRSPATVPCVPRVPARIWHGAVLSIQCMRVAPRTRAAARAAAVTPCL
jgi:hypothetical protein